ncbi:hypothetical protein [Bremerella cremea]|uniref:TolB family protein n=1 Tax=Bremerella cremea TaxID=1031537 RepID=UPI0031E8A0DC
MNTKPMRRCWMVLLLGVGTLVGCFGMTQVEHAHVGFDLSPDGQTVVFSSSKGDLFLWEIETETLTRLTDTSIIETLPCFSPDGKSIVYARSQAKDNSFQICRLDIDTRKVTELTTTPDTNDMCPQFSTDGSTVFFALATLLRDYSLGGKVWDKWYVCQVPAAGGPVTQITDEPYSSLYRIVQQADGTLVYSAENYKMPTVYTRLYRIGEDGIPTPFTPADQDAASRKDAHYYDVALASDQQTLVYVCDTRKDFYYDIRSDHGDAVPQFLARSEVRMNRYPAMAPNDEYVYFLAGTSANFSNRTIYSLWRVDRNGETEEVLPEAMLTDPVP